MLRGLVLTLVLGFAASASWAGIAEDCAQSGDPDLQIGACTAVIRSGDWSGKNLAIAYNQRGAAYISLKQYTRAIEDFDRAIRLEPGDAVAYNNRGFAYINLKQSARAIEEFDQAIRLDPGYAFAYNNRGAAYSFLTQYARAIEDYDQAVRLDPGYASAYASRAFAHRSLGQKDEADQDFGRYYRMAGKTTVKGLQKYLRKQGYYSGVIDGIYSSGTSAAFSLCTADPDCR